MTSSEPLLPVPEDDALDAAASAVVDGVATPEEAALVAAAPNGPARVAALRAVADAVSAPGRAQDPAAAASGLAAALAAFDAPAAVAGDRDPSVLAPVTHVPAGSRRGRLPNLAAVAAALVLLIGIGALSVAVLSQDERDATTSTAAAPARDEALESAPSTAATLAVAGVPPTPVDPTMPAGGVPGTRATSETAAPAAAAPPPVVNGGALGRQDEVEDVALRAAAALNGIPDTAVAAPGAALPSDVQACVTAGAATVSEVLGPLRYRATGTYQGTDAIFLVFDRSGDQPPRLLLVLSRNGCSPLATTQF